MLKRQGDILVTRVEKIPVGSVKIDTLTLAVGEALDHEHKLNLGEIFEKDGTLYFKVPEGKVANLVHPEHRSLSFEPGIYQVTQQREFQPKGWRHVSD
jgi:hypothetical protein